jgi:hypothetical protein
LRLAPRLLDSMRSGSDGVALFALAPLLSLVTDEESHANMPRGADELVRRWVQGQSVAPSGAAAARPDFVDVHARSGGKAAPPASGGASGRDWLWGALGGAAAVGLFWAVRTHSREPVPAFPELPLSVLETLAAESEMTGPQASLIVRRLESLGPTELARIRTKSLLSRVSEAGGQLADSDAFALDPGRLTINKATAAGWIRDVDGNWSLTPQGRRFLDELMSQHDLQHWDRFVAERLGESLKVACPTCGAVLASLWLRPTLGCLSCHHRFPIDQSPAVTVETRIELGAVPASANRRSR